MRPGSTSYAPVRTCSRRLRPPQVLIPSRLTRTSSPGENRCVDCHQRRIADIPGDPERRPSSFRKPNRSGRRPDAEPAADGVQGLFESKVPDTQRPFVRQQLRNAADNIRRQNNFNQPQPHGHSRFGVSTTSDYVDSFASSSIVSASAAAASNRSTLSAARVRTRRENPGSSPRMPHMTPTRPSERIRIFSEEPFPATMDILVCGLQSAVAGSGRCKPFASDYKPRLL